MSPASKHANATAHLSEVDIKEIGRELDQLRDEIIASRGENDGCKSQKWPRREVGKD